MIEISELLQYTHIAIPVALVIVCAILVFAFGFKKAEQPPFAHLSSVVEAERKTQTKKKSKSKEKRTANGQVTTEKASPSKKLAKSEVTNKKSNKSTDEVDGKVKERKQDDNKTTTAKKEKNVEIKTKENKVEQVKNKKNMKNLLQEKPVDFDEGDWEQAYSRKDKLKKKREEESPSKKSKKNKKGDLINENKDQNKPEVKDKVAKETENKELKEKDNKEVVLTPISNEEPEKEIEVEIIEEVSTVEESPKVEKVGEKKSGKGKKGKKSADADNTKAEAIKESKVVTANVEKNMSEATTKTQPIEIIDADLIEEKAVAPAFNELGDVWKEAKPQKKNKKKSRKDN